MRNWHPFLARDAGRDGDDGARRASASSSRRSAPRPRGSATETTSPGAGRGRRARPRSSSRLAVVRASGFVAAVADHARRAGGVAPTRARRRARVHGPQRAGRDGGGVALRRRPDVGRRGGRAARHRRWSLAYQSRSGGPRDPWLEPDINASSRARRWRARASSWCRSASCATTSRCSTTSRIDARGLLVVGVDARHGDPAVIELASLRREFHGSARVPSLAAGPDPSPERHRLSRRASPALGHVRRDRHDRVPLGLDEPRDARRRRRGSGDLKVDVIVAVGTQAPRAS